MSQCLRRITFIGPTSISILRLSRSFILSAFPWLARLGPNLAQPGRLAGGAYAPSARRRLAWFVRPQFTRAGRIRRHSRKFGIGRFMRTLLVALLLALSNAALGDTITVTPSTPNSAQSVTLFVDGISNVFPVGMVPRQFSVQGNSIRIEGCQPFPAFSGLSTYRLTVNVGILVPGSYSVQYFTSRCTSDLVPIDPFALSTSITFEVFASTQSSPIPASSWYSLGMLAIILACVAVIRLRQSRAA